MSESRGPWAWAAGVALLLVFLGARFLVPASGRVPAASSTPPTTRPSPAVNPTTPVAPIGTGLSAEEWARPFDIEGVRLGMTRDEAWRHMGDRSRWRLSTMGPLDVWTSLDLPARRVVYGGDGRVEAVSGLSLEHQGRTVFSGDAAHALLYLGPPDLKGNALVDETWIWNRHGSTGFIGLHVKSGRVVLSRSEDRVL